MAKRLLSQLAHVELFTPRLEETESFPPASGQSIPEPATLANPDLVNSSEKQSSN